MSSDEEGRHPDIAFYYPGPIWYSGDAIKNLLLFFDGVALLVPAYMSHRLTLLDPPMVEGLQHYGLLHVLEPETLVDKRATEKLAEAMTEVIVSGALDDLADGESAFEEISYSRVGGYGEPELARMILEELESRGLAGKSVDGLSVPMHRKVRSLVLVLLSQILRSHGPQLGLNLSPATDRPQLVSALRELLSIPALPSAGAVISAELRRVGIDVGSVPLDELVDFRKSHLAEHRSYILSVKRFVRDLGAMEASERSAAMAQRAAELEEMARSLRKSYKGLAKKGAAFSIGLSGAYWTFKSGDPTGAGIAALAALLGLSQDQYDVGSWAYLFRAGGKYA